MNWISVKDRLPEKQCYIIVTFGSGRPGLICWTPGDSWIQRNVTHWMPLPEPPPPPDPFDEWAKAHEWAPHPNHIAITNDDNESVSTISKRCARQIWDAARSTNLPPDQFEDWWANGMSKRFHGGRTHLIAHSEARIIWDAALASTKKT